MTQFDDVILPLTISIGSSTGGPLTSTDVLRTDSGFRKANQRWDQRLHRLNLKYGVRTDNDIAVIIRIFNAMAGPANSFLARDWADWNTTAGSMADSSQITASDQPMQNTVTGGILGDGSTTTFTARKDYTEGSATHKRRIYKPQNDSNIVVEVDGVEVFEGGDFTVDYSDGTFTFSVAPGASETVTWGGGFYIPVAFVSDDLLQMLDLPDIRSLPDILLLEERQ